MHDAPFEVDPESGCWVWTGRTIRGIYGLWQDTTAHRAIWRESGRELPDGLDLHHTCPNKLCVNPDHMELVEAREHRRRHASRNQGGRSKHRGVYYDNTLKRWFGSFKAPDGKRHKTKRCWTEEEAAEAVVELRRALAQSGGS